MYFFASSLLILNNYLYAYSSVIKLQKYLRSYIITGLTAICNFMVDIQLLLPLQKLSALSKYLFPLMSFSSDVVLEELTWLENASRHFFACLVFASVSNPFCLSSVLASLLVLPQSSFDSCLSSRSLLLLWPHRAVSHPAVSSLLIRPLEMASVVRCTCK